MTIEMISKRALEIIEESLKTSETYAGTKAEFEALRDLCADAKKSSEGIIILKALSDAFSAIEAIRYYKNGNAFVLEGKRYNPDEYKKIINKKSLEFLISTYTVRFESADDLVSKLFDKSES